MVLVNRIVKVDFQAEHHGTRGTFVQRWKEGEVNHRLLCHGLKGSAHDVCKEMVVK